MPGSRNARRAQNWRDDGQPNSGPSSRPPSPPSADRPPSPPGLPGPSAEPATGSARGRYKRPLHPIEALPNKPWEELTSHERKRLKRRPENEFFDLSELGEMEAGDDGQAGAEDVPEVQVPPTSKFTPFKRMVFSESFDDDDKKVDDKPPSYEEALTTPAVEISESGELREINGGGEGVPRASLSDAPARLLLPEHVVVEGDGDEDEAEEADDDEDEEEIDMTGIAVIDDSRAAGVIRYYDPSVVDEFFASADLGRVCRNCKRPGHTERECNVLVCFRCGEEGHERNDCPHSGACRYCGQTGHGWQNCPQRREQRLETGRTGCPLCGSNSHGATGCQLAWRAYVYYTPVSRKEAIERKERTTSWEKEAVGGDPAIAFCYNCAGTGHYGDDCPRPKGTKAPIFGYSSAFSDSMASRGPYGAALSMHRHPDATHTKWVDDLPEVDPGFAAFGGASAGQRGREGKKARQRHLDRQRDRMDQAEDWFSSRDDYDRTMRDSWRDRGPPRGPQSFRRDGGRGREQSPDRRGGSLASRISGPSGSGGTFRFGNMSAPSGSGRNVNDNWRARPSDGRGGRYDRDRGEAELEERQWRASGAGGGSVVGWGEQMDSEERRMRDDRPRAGPVRAGGGGGGGGRGRGGGGGRGQARGQRYTGGY